MKIPHRVSKRVLGPLAANLHVVAQTELELDPRVELGGGEGGHAGEHGGAVELAAVASAEAPGASVARWQNLIPSFPWIAPGWRAWGRNPNFAIWQHLMSCVSSKSYYLICTVTASHLTFSILSRRS